VLGHLPARRTDSEVDENRGCLKASLTAVAVPAAVLLLLLATRWRLYPLEAPLLVALAIGVVLGVRSEHLHGSAWLKVGATALALALPIWLVLTFLAWLGAISDEAIIILLAVLSLPLVIRAASWLRSLRNMPP
jgi:hypothetical protein